MKTYITRAEALDRYDITPDELDDLMQSEQFDVLHLVDQGQEHLIIYDDDLAAYIADRDITPNKFDHLRGNLLGMSDAALKYHVTPSTVSRWVANGHIEIKGRDGQKKLVDEADVAYVVTLAKAKKIRQGKRLFD